MPPPDDPRDDRPVDPLAAKIAMLDQAEREQPHVARAARIVFDCYEAEGFTANQALYLTAVTLVEPPFPPP